MYFFVYFNKNPGWVMRIQYFDFKSEHERKRSKRKRSIYLFCVYPLQQNEILHVFQLVRKFGSVHRASHAGAGRVKGFAQVPNTSSFYLISRKVLTIEPLKKQ